VEESTDFLESWRQLPPPVCRQCRKSHTQRTVPHQPPCSPGVPGVFADISQVSTVHYLPTSDRMYKYLISCQSAWPPTGWPVSKSLRTHPMLPMLTTNPRMLLIRAPPRVFTRTPPMVLIHGWPKLLASCAADSSQTCPDNVSFGWCNLIYLQNSTPQSLQPSQPLGHAGR